jgi:hypothetical protein
MTQIQFFFINSFLHFDGWNMFLGKILKYFYLLSKGAGVQNNYYGRFII